MTARELFAQLQTQLDQGRVPREQEVVVRLAGRDYTVRSIDVSTAALVLEGGAEVIHDDTLPGPSGAVPRAELSQETAAADAFAAAVPEVTTEVATPRTSALSSAKIMAAISVWGTTMRRQSAVTLRLS